MNKRSVRDLEVRDKRVLVRVDFNVPVKDGEVTDDTRIRRALPTIRYLLEEGARPILISHLGRPKGEPDPKYAMDPVAALADLYVNDAFGAAHRAHATTVGVAERQPAAAGLLMEEEIDYLDKVLKDPERPFVAILGGAKVSDKLGVIESLLGTADSLLIGGAMGFTFFQALGYEVGDSLVEDDYLEEAKRLMDEAGDRLVLPVDVVVADAMEEDAESEAGGGNEKTFGKKG